MTALTMANAYGVDWPRLTHRCSSGARQAESCRASVESEPFLLPLLGLPVEADQLASPSAEARKARTFEAMRQLFLTQAAGFLYETGFLPDRTYTFKHALTQEVGYDSLPQERRHALHARIVEAIDPRLAISTVLGASGESRRILAALREAETLAEALGDPNRLGQVSQLLSYQFYLMGAYDQALATAQLAVQPAAEVAQQIGYMM